MEDKEIQEKAFEASLILRELQGSAQRLVAQSTLVYEVIGELTAILAPDDRAAKDRDGSDRLTPKIDLEWLSLNLAIIAKDPKRAVRYDAMNALVGDISEAYVRNDADNPNERTEATIWELLRKLHAQMSLLQKLLTAHNSRLSNVIALIE